MEYLVRAVGDALAKVPELCPRRRWCYPEDDVVGLRRRQVMVPRAHPADTRYNAREFLHWSSDTELLEAAKLHHIDESICYITAIIKINSYLGMTLNSGYWGYCDRFHKYLPPYFFGRTGNGLSRF